MQDLMGNYRHIWYVVHDMSSNLYELSKLQSLFNVYPAWVEEQLPCYMWAKEISVSVFIGIPIFVGFYSLRYWNTHFGVYLKGLVVAKGALDKESRVSY